MTRWKELILRFVALEWECFWFCPSHGFVVKSIRCPHCLEAATPDVIETYWGPVPLEAS